MSNRDWVGNRKTLGFVMSKRVKLEFDERSLVSIDRLSEQGAIMAPLQKHTEGPWHVWNEQFPRIGPTHNCTVAGVFACPVGDQQANAKLLAAAPEMLEALKSAMQCLDDFVGDGPTYRMVKAAIAKAEGASVCNRKVEDFVCTETGESSVMLQVAELVTKYGDASYDCGEHSGDRYGDCVEKLLEARKALMQFLHEVVQK